ncbi:MAG: hypothetical protein KDJ65_00550 [Anaerolineae bacterium]|nr:hypothetical protein [Anaerolineae bacterium]
MPLGGTTLCKTTKRDQAKTLRPSSAAVIGVVYILYFGACGLLLGRGVAIYLSLEETVLIMASVGLAFGSCFGISLSMITAETAPYTMLVAIPIFIVILFQQPGYKVTYGNLIMLIGVALMVNTIVDIIRPSRMRKLI